MGPSTDLLQAIRPADVLDIAFITVLLYTVLTWFRETTSRPVYVGLAILAAVYFVAQSFDMVMTAMFFQATLAFLLVALVVVFQEDLRRVFVRVSSLGSIRDTRHRPTTFSHVDTLVTTAADLAGRKTGALVVIRGREPLDRHVAGGIDTDARISKPLLDSIFDPHSMGHDGAVIIEGNRLKSFAAHLPLSRNLKEVGPRGTRHSAALGLSEVCDAFVIVVSEERGEISVAESGKLKLMPSAAQLQARLERFCHQQYPGKAEEFWTRLVKKHAALKAVSLILACLGWYLLSYQAETVQKTFRLPVELRNVPDNLAFDSPTSEVKVTLSGRERAFDLLAASALRVSLDVSDIEEGSHQIALEDDDVRRPGNLAVFGIEPRSLFLDAHKLVAAQLPIEVETYGRSPDRLEVKSLRVTPAAANVMVWRGERNNTTKLTTTPIDLSKFTKTTTVTASLDLPRHVRTVNEEPLQIRITVEVAPKTTAQPEAENPSPHS